MSDREFLSQDQTSLFNQFLNWLKGKGDTAQTAPPPNPSPAGQGAAGNAETGQTTAAQTLEALRDENAALRARLEAADAALIDSRLEHLLDTAGAKRVTPAMRTQMKAVGQGYGATGDYAGFKAFLLALPVHAAFANEAETEESEPSASAPNLDPRSIYERRRLETKGTGTVAYLKGGKN